MIGEHLRLGFIPLADCAPLAVADAFGLFEAEGLTVTLSREVSWATIRDKVQARLLDGAHMLGPLALASTLGAGAGAAPGPVIAPMALNLNGSAITVSRDLAARMREAAPELMAARPCTAGALKLLIERRRRSGERPLAFAAVHPVSMHAYELRYWLAEAGIDPDRDIRFLITPPPRMAAQLKSGEIDGFCVGAPWNTVAEAQGSGEILIRAREFWSGGPDKVLGVAAAFAQREPEALQALLRALIKAAAWADAGENRPALAELLARPEYVGEPAEVLRGSLVEAPDAIVFHARAANFPWISHAAWFLAQMRRWGQMPPEIDILAAAGAVYRPDLYRQAAAALGVAAPETDMKIEGGHAEPWTLDTPTGPITMSADRLCDGQTFDPDKLEAYLQRFAIRREQVAAGP